jgi:hypothetical protein
MSAPKRKSAKAFLPNPEFLYDAGTRRYWTRDTRGNWISVSERSLERHLRALGYNPSPPKGEFLSQLDKQIVEIQLTKNISFAGALAGYRQGEQEVCGHRILVTKPPKLIEPTTADFPTLRQILEGMFLDPQRDQRPYVFAWLKLSIEALRAGLIRPAQVLAMAGPANTFKSSFQNLITLLLGGRSAKPYRYMSGQTDFNKELLGAEHMMIEDEVASTSIRHRRHFGAKIKEFTVNETQSCHGKGLDAITLRPFWRVTISLNDEPEHLLILPPLDEGLADKIILLKAKSFSLPMPTATIEQREIFWKTLVAELPGFVGFLNSFDITPELMSNRFGSIHYHHPDLLSAIDALAPETRLLALIDTVIFGGNTFPKDWRGSAADLEKLLLNSEMSYEARKLLEWDNAGGTYLGRLAAKLPNRVRQDRKSNLRGWIISPPSPGMTP